MERRTFLTALTSFPTAGCVGNAGRGDETTSQHITTTTKTMTSSTHSDSEPLRTVTVKQSDSLTTMLQTSLSANLLKSEITRNHTALLEIRITNTSCTEQTYDFGHISVFSATASVDERWLLVEPNQLESPSGECWSHPKSDEEPGSLATRKQLAPEESATQKFELWSNSKLEERECMPPGEYRFEDEYRVKNGSEESSDFQWGFTLEIRK